jgi:hypothetical protein
MQEALRHFHGPSMLTVVAIVCIASLLGAALIVLASVPDLLEAIPDIPADLAATTGALLMRSPVARSKATRVVVR